MREPLRRVQALPAGRPPECFAMPLLALLAFALDAGASIRAHLARRCLLLAAVSALALPAHANTLRIASAFDPQTFDPHAIALLYHSRVNFQIYESLVGRNEDFNTEPALALS